MSSRAKLWSVSFWSHPLPHVRSVPSLWTAARSCACGLRHAPSGVAFWQPFRPKACSCVSACIRRTHVPIRPGLVGPSIHALYSGWTFVSAVGSGREQQSGSVWAQPSDYYFMPLLKASATLGTAYRPILPQSFRQHFFLAASALYSVTAKAFGARCLSARLRAAFCLTSRWSCRRAAGLALAQPPFSGEARARQIEWALCTRRFESAAAAAAGGRAAAQRHRVSARRSSYCCSIRCFVQPGVRRPSHRAEADINRCGRRRAQDSSGESGVPGKSRGAGDPQVLRSAPPRPL